MHQHHQPSPTTPCFTKSFSKSGQVRFDNSFVEYSSVNRADIPNTRLSPTRLKPYRLMSITRGSLDLPQRLTQQPLFIFVCIIGARQNQSSTHNCTCLS